MSLISKRDFEALASEYGFAAAHHETGAYEMFDEYLREALEETVAAAMLAVPVTEEATISDLQLGPAVRKRMRVYIWPMTDQ